MHRTVGLIELCLVMKQPERVFVVRIVQKTSTFVNIIGVSPALKPGGFSARDLDLGYDWSSLNSLLYEISSPDFRFSVLMSTSLNLKHLGC